MQAHNAITRATELLRGLSTSVGLVEGGVERLGETLTPIFNIWGQPEHAYLRGETLWVGRYTEVAGGAGLWSTVQISINATSQSNVIAVVSRVYPTAVIAVNAPTAGGTLLTDRGGVRPRDTRLSSGELVRINSGTLAAGPDPSMVRCPANTWTDLNYVVTRDTFFQARAIAANTAIDLSMIGYYRQAFPGELRG